MALLNLFKLNKIERIFAKHIDGERVILTFTHKNGYSEEQTLNRNEVSYLATMVNKGATKQIVTTDNQVFTKDLLKEMHCVCDVSVERDF